MGLWWNRFSGLCCMGIRCNSPGLPFLTSVPNRTGACLFFSASHDLSWQLKLRHRNMNWESWAMGTVLAWCSGSSSRVQQVRPETWALQHLEQPQLRLPVHLGSRMTESIFWSAWRLCKKQRGERGLCTLSKDALFSTTYLEFFSIACLQCKYELIIFKKRFI